MEISFDHTTARGVRAPIAGTRVQSRPSISAASCAADRCIVPPRTRGQRPAVSISTAASRGAPVSTLTSARAGKPDRGPSANRLRHRYSNADNVRRTHSPAMQQTEIACRRATILSVAPGPRNSERIAALTATLERRYWRSSVLPSAMAATVTRAQGGAPSFRPGPAGRAAWRDARRSCAAGHAGRRGGHRPRGARRRCPNAPAASRRAGRE